MPAPLESQPAKAGPQVDSRSYFYAIAETAAAPGVSPATANRRWSEASAWLRRELEEDMA